MNFLLTNESYLYAKFVLEIIYFIYITSSEDCYYSLIVHVTTILDESLLIYFYPIFISLYNQF